jgi:hypothetical protein
MISVRYNYIMIPRGPDGQTPPNLVLVAFFMTVESIKYPLATLSILSNFPMAPTAKPLLFQ